MKKFTRLFLTGIFLILFSSYGIAQQKPVISSVIGKLIRVTPKLADIDKTTMYGAPIVKTREGDGFANGIVDPEAAEEMINHRTWFPTKTDNRQQIFKNVQQKNAANHSNNPTPNVPSVTVNVNMDGQVNPGLTPSDNNLAVGPNDVIQMINASGGCTFEIWNKAGTVVKAKALLSSVTGITGYGDPVVIYDQLADRFLLTEFAAVGQSFINTLVIAISSTNDPTGSWNVYSYQDNGYFTDYPKYAVWSNAYYATSNEFNTSGTAYIGSYIWAFDRNAMLAGNGTATAVKSLMTNAANRYYSMAPVCLEGTAPSPNQSGLFAFLQDDAWVGGGAVDSIFTFEFTPDFVTPSNSTVGPFKSLATQPYNTNVPAVPQQGGSGVPNLNSRLMHQVIYRNFGTSESIVCNTVDNVGSGRNGVHWWELRRPESGDWSIYQEGVLAPAGDNNGRFMAGIAINGNGDIGMIYNISGSSMYPSIRFIGRNSCDALGTMTSNEIDVYDGTAPNTVARYGDYNGCAVDPVDGSFWTTAQYNANGYGTYGNWVTRVANFTLSPGQANFTQQPSNTSVCAGTPATFTVTVNGLPPLTYQWQESTDGGATWHALSNTPPYSGVTTGTLTINPVTAGMNNYQYNCVASSSCGSPATSNAATLTITTLSQGGTISPASTNVCPPTNSTTLTLSGVIGNVIQWESSIDGGTTWVTIANTTLTYTAVNVLQNTIYRALVQSSGCSPTYSTTAAINFINNGVLALNITTDNGTVLCAGTPDLLTVNDSGGPLGAGYTFLWSPAAGLNATNTNPVAASPNLTTNYSVLVTNGSGCTGTASILITVKQLPLVTTQPANVSLCTTGNATFSITATGTGIGYQWQESTNGGVSYSDITNGGIYSGATTPTLTLTGVTFAMNNNHYRCNVFGACPPMASSNAAILTVKALPVIALTPTIGCGGVAGINGLLLSTGSLAPPVPGSATISSGTISVPVPDNNPSGAVSNLSVSGIPANATITGISVTWNMPHTWDGDMVFAIKAPNGNILNLDWFLSGTGGASATTGFVNTTVSSVGVNALSSGSNPYTGTFKADAHAAASGGPTGYAPTGTTWNQLYSTPNGTYTLAMYDGGGGDVGTLTSWQIKIDYTTPGGTGSPLTYTWSPATGLYNDASTTIPYVSGTQTPSVYAAPTSFTTYTVTGTDATTGCSNTATALVNYTPPAPAINPNPVAMCLGDAAVRLTSSSSTSSIINVSSGTISIIVPDANPTGRISNLTVAGIPANAVISNMSVTLNMNHTYIADESINLKAPNGQILNLDRNLGGTGNQAGTYPNIGFVNCVISSTGTVSLATANSQPITGTFKADAINNAVTPGYTYSDPTGYVANATSFANLYSIPNGTWTLAMADDGAGDVGTLTSWSLNITYVIGVPSTPGSWSPITGLYTDAAATVAYTGTPSDTVYTKPTPAGTYTYQATVNSLPPPAVTSTMSNYSSWYAATITFNVRNNNAYPVILSSLSSGTAFAGATNVSVYYKPSAISGLPGAITAANGWNQFGSAAVTGLGFGNGTQPFISGLNLQIPAGATYGIVLQALQGAGSNLLFSNVPTNLIASAGGCDIITGAGIGYAGNPVPAAPIFTPYYFNGSVSFVPGIPPCTSPARSVTVTVNQPISITSQPVAATVCTNNTTSFSVAATGTTPNYQWQVSTDGGNTFTNVTNGGVYSGSTTTTLTITAPPVSMNGNIYRCAVSGAAPCATVNSTMRTLTVNPLPTVVISAAPYLRLYPGLITTISSTSTPAAATYTWFRNGAILSGATASSLPVNVDGLGTYSLTVTDVNGCINSSNQVTISDSAMGKVFIYPNPNSGQFQVRYDPTPNNVMPRGIIVYDAKGSRVLNQLYTLGWPYASMNVDLSNQGPGVYWLEVVDLNGQRLVVGRVEVLR